MFKGPQGMFLAGNAAAAVIRYQILKKKLFIFIGSLRVARDNKSGQFQIIRAKMFPPSLLFSSDTPMTFNMVLEPEDPHLTQ